MATDDEQVDGSEEEDGGEGKPPDVVRQRGSWWMSREPPFQGDKTQDGPDTGERGSSFGWLHWTAALCKVNSLDSAAVVRLLEAQKSAQVVGSEA